jgi:poly(A) polymerase
VAARGGPRGTLPGPAAALARAGFRVIEGGINALCRYCGRGAREPLLPVNFLLTDAGQADLARVLEDVSYPGLPYADLAAEEEGLSYRFLCDALGGADAGPPGGSSAFVQGALRFDPLRGVFLDPEGVYPRLRVLELEPRFDPAGPWPAEALFEAAVLVSRTPYSVPRASAAGQGSLGGSDPDRSPAGTAMQRDLLSLVLTGAYPWKGLGLLRDAGFIEREWPEIAQLFDVEHSKEFHPEGGAWDHTLETFRYRKEPDLLLSLALLLHDTGKPLSINAEGHRFDRHAELGARTARDFLGRLGFPSALSASVSFLVGKHMLPAALPRLPLSRTEEALESPLFPVLLELFRCDMSSTFMGPGAYYEACTAYRRYKRNVKNPYRKADGSLRKKE